MLQACAQKRALGTEMVCRITSYEQAIGPFLFFPLHCMEYGTWVKDWSRVREDTFFGGKNHGCQMIVACAKLPGRE